MQSNLSLQVLLNLSLKWTNKGENSLQIKLFKSLWEYVKFEGLPLTIRMDDQIKRIFERIAKAGYSGIESPLPSLEQEDWFRRLLDSYQLEFIAQVLTKDEHSESFALQARRAAEFQPLMIVSHSANDSMAYEDQLSFFRKAVVVEEEIKLPVAHETHRGRAMFTPWNTAKLLKDVDGLKITADFSHWCCVCESLLDAEDNHMTTAIERAIHIHRRNLFVMTLILRVWVRKLILTCLLNKALTN
jgi:sugar phosphate isomerase/epimerase